MSVFTMLMKDILTSEGGSFSIVDGRMVVTKPEILGLGHYPIFDEAHRETLNGLIFGTYMNQEIGVETYEMWLVDIITHMNLNMPYYNKLYEANLLDFDPLSTIDVKTENTSQVEQATETLGTTASTTEGSSTGVSSTEAESSSKSRAVSSDTPQSALSGNADYATNAADSASTTENDATSTETGETSTTGSGTETGETSTTGTENTDSHVHGYQGHTAELVARYRETLVSVDRMVIASLQPYFMSVLATANRTFQNRNNHYGL